MENKTESASGGDERAEDSFRREHLLHLLSLTSSQQQSLPHEHSTGGDAQQGTDSSNERGLLQRSQAAQMPNQGENTDALLSRNMDFPSRVAQITSVGGSPYMNALAHSSAALGPSEDELLTRLLLSRVQASNRQQLLNDLLRTTPITDLDDETLYRLRARQGALTSFRPPLQAGSGIYGQTHAGVLGPPFSLGGASALSREQLRYHAEHNMSRSMMGSFPSLGVGQSSVASGNRDLKRDRDNVASRTEEEETQPKDKKKQKKAPKKKPADMPRRPLSAYNLFFSEERERILREMSDEADKTDPGDGTGSDGEKKKDSAPSNDEGKEDDQLSANATGAVECRALKRPLVRDNSKRRPHRKTHGKIGFKSLAQMVGQRWRSLPSEKLSYYQKLAEEDTKRQKLAMEEYYKKKNAKPAEVMGTTEAKDKEKGTGGESS